ncbi:MAG: DUF2306 domain-containing protein [Gemmatimonadaceae bacterium]
MSARVTYDEGRRFAAVPRRGLRGGMLAVIAVLCALVAAYALAIVVLPSMRPPLMQQRVDQHPVPVMLHLAVGAMVIALAPLQLIAGIRRRWPVVHRWSGRAYAVGVLLSGVGGLALATVSQGGTPAHLGFAFLSLAWMATTAIGVQRIRAGDVAEHRRWMVRSFALTFAAVTLRIYIPLSVATGLPYEPSYQAIAWLCWVPNLLVAEWLLRARRRPVQSPAPLVAG